VIPAENLPEEYGGTCRCGEGGCIVVQDTTALSPEMWDPELTEANVGAGQSVKLEFEAKGGPSQVTWFYRTHKHDIKFSVHFVRKGDSNSNVLVEPTKFDSALARVEGTATVEGEGTVTVTFDNSYSYWNSKTVRYFVAVESLDVAQ